RLDRIRLDRQRVTQGHLGLVESSNGSQGRSQVGMCVGVPRVQYDGALKANHRLIEPPYRLQSDAHVVLCFGETWIQFRRSTIVRQGLVEPAQIVKNGAQIAVRAGVSGTKC